MHESNIVRDTFIVAMDRAREMADNSGIVGYGTVVLTGSDGEIKTCEPFCNLITDYGDEYYAKMAVALVQPANSAQPVVVNGMKLGTGTTAAAKSGAGAALVTYIAASNNPFDATYPQTANLGAGLGWNAVYKTTWAAGDVTNTAITEAVIVDNAATDATTLAGDTISRVVFTAINKAAGDSLAITWSHKFLGA